MVSVQQTAPVYESLTQNAHKYQGVSKLFARWMSGESAAATAVVVPVLMSVSVVALAPIVATIEPDFATESVVEVLSVEQEEKEKESVVVDPVVVGELKPELLSSEVEVEVEREGDETVAAELRREEENQDLPALIPADSGVDMSEPCGALVAVNVECCVMSFVEEMKKDGVIEVVEKKQKKWNVSNVVSRAMRAMARFLPRRNNRVQAI
ncbi:hypothetical protein GGF32_000968 [Allomyces javanicus]|nr:hypothetical protein GGF32_000968 [Allomyces javanicus]